jgi:hypothetical protein
MIPVGYLQIYNAYDFPRATPLISLPSQLAALDIFIGEESALHKGLGAKIINEFLAQYHDFDYTHILVDPDKDNIAAIRTYENAGFRIVAEHQDANELWMLKENSTAELIKLLELDLLKSSVRSSKVELDKLLADNFFEYGSSGQVHYKQDVLNTLPTENIRKFEVDDLKVQELSDTVILVTYKTVEKGITCLRSSIWKKHNTRWQMIFHQGTKVNKK